MKKILLLFFLAPLLIFAQTNLDLPKTTSTAGQIRIGGQIMLHSYGVNNYFAAGSGNFVMQLQGQGNVAIGLEALSKNLIGDYNTAIGHYAGKMNRYGRRNIFLGYNAGNNSTFADLSDQLIIDNTTTASPFIYGRLGSANRSLTVNAPIIRFPQLTESVKTKSIYFDENSGDLYYGDSYALAPEDTNLWYKDGNTIRNKSRHLVEIDSGLTLPHPIANMRLGYILGWEHTNGNVDPFPISQLMDTAKHYGYINDVFVYDSLTNSIYPRVDTGAYLGLKTTRPIANLDVRGSVFFRGSPPDIDGDGMVFVSDLDSILSVLGMNDENPITDPNTFAHLDIDGNGEVNWTDAYVLNKTYPSFDPFPEEERNKVMAKWRAGRMYGTMNDNDFGIFANLKMHKQVYAPYLDSNETSRMIYYDTKNGKFSFGMTPTTGINYWEKDDDTLFARYSGTDLWIRGKNFIHINQSGGTPRSYLGIGQAVPNYLGSSIAIGDWALNGSTATYTTAVGQNAGSSSAGMQGTFMGWNSGWYNNGNFNTGLGQGACEAQTGDTNVCIGFNTGYYGSMDRVIAIGPQALQQNNSRWVIAIGDRAGYGNSGSNNIFIGNLSAGAFAFNGIFNATLGDSTLRVGTTANYNTAIGHGSLAKNTTGDNNTSIGYQALHSNTTGVGNIAIGFRAGYGSTGDNKIYIGEGDSTTALIFGNRSINKLTINGGLKTTGLTTSAQAYFLVTDSNGDFYKMDTTGWYGGGGGDSYWQMTDGWVENKDYDPVRIYTDNDQDFDGTFHPFILRTSHNGYNAFNSIGFKDALGDTLSAAIVVKGSETGLAPDKSGNMSFYFRNNDATLFTKRFEFGNESANDYTRFKIFGLFSESVVDADHTLVWDESTGDVMPMDGVPIMQNTQGFGDHTDTDFSGVDSGDVPMFDDNSNTWTVHNFGSDFASLSDTSLFDKVGNWISPKDSRDSLLLGLGVVENNGAPQALLDVNGDAIVRGDLDVQNITNLNDLGFASQNDSIDADGQVFFNMNNILKWYANGKWRIFADYDSINTLIEQAALTSYFDPDSSVVTKGTPTGTVNNLDYHDASYWLITEVTGSPGIDIQAKFDSVTADPQHLIFQGRYEGTGDEVAIQLWNYTNNAWETYGTINSSADVRIEYTITDPAEHRSNNFCKVRFYHADAGNPSHKLYIDFLTLSAQGISGDGGGADNLGNGIATTDLNMNGYNITGAVTWEIDPTPNSDHTATGQILYVTAGETVAFGDLLYVKSDGELSKANATSTAKMDVVYVALGSGTDGNSVLVLEDGYIRDDSWSWTIGQKVYASAGSTAFTQTAPTGADDVVQVLGIATAATIIKFVPQFVDIELW